MADGEDVVNKKDDQNSNQQQHLMVEGQGVQFEDNSQNGRLYSVTTNLLSSEQRNHVRLKSSDIELGEPEQEQEQEIALGTKLLEQREVTKTTPSIHQAPNEKKPEDSSSPDGYISQLDKFGNIQQVPINFGEVVDDPEPNPLADFMSTDILAKPFNFVSGNVSKSRFNPFRKKSGLLNVLAKQATRNRVVAKNGFVNTVGSADGKKHKFFKDIFISLIDLNWGWIFLLFAAGFFLSWLGFAVVWYLTFLQHGDFDPVNQSNESFIPCASAIKDFTSCFLFSLETQHTIGYGVRAMTEQCPFAIIVMSLQSILGVIIQACMAGIIFAKFTVPRNRGETIVFSKNAVITIRNGSLYLMCRVTDLRKSSLLESHVRMVVIMKEVTEEGEVIPYQQSDLECGSESDGSNDRILMLWPVTLAHKIDSESVFYNMTPRDILAAQFELIVTLEGVTEETGNTIQVRTSYLPNEILWGHRFDNDVVVYEKNAGIYTVFHSRINKSVTDDTPRCSARQLDMRKKRRNSGMSSSNESKSPEDTDFTPKKCPLAKMERSNVAQAIV